MYSTGLRDFVGMYGGYKRALQGGVMKIYSGSAPATADAAASGTLLCTVSLASGTHTPEVCSAGSTTLAGSSGSVTALTVNSIEILGATVTFTSDLTTTAALVAAQINSYVPVAGPEYIATSSGAKVIITALPGTGTTPNGYVVATTVSTLTKTDVNMGTEVAGVASVNGLTYGSIASGVLSKSGTWSGVVETGGVAGYFRLCGSVVDAGGSSTTLIRIQGTCGVSGADYNMTSTTLTAAATHTVDTGTITLPAS
jgi:hypothetical protein